jgi:hypothetical protein
MFLTISVQPILDFLDDFGSIISGGIGHNSRELRIMDEIDANPAVDVDSLIQHDKGWTKINRQEMIDYQKAVQSKRYAQ